MDGASGLGDAHLAIATERILNRGAQGPGLPIELTLPVLLAMGVWFFGAALYLVGPFPNAQWVGGCYLALGLLYPLAIWGSHASWIDVGPNGMSVHMPLRDRKIPMDEIVQIEARRHWRSPFGTRRPPRYWLLIRTRARWARQIQYLEPEAGDRVLAALHRAGKPIWLFG